MPAEGFTFFETAIGTCAIAWGMDGVCAVQLPGASQSATRKRIRALCPNAVEQAPSSEAAAARDSIVALIAGTHVDMSAIRLDMADLPPFDRGVYEVARTVGPGETTTYGEIAKRLGMPREAQAVGQALGKNPFPIVVPCHRVLAKGGKTGGFSAPGGVATKLRLLAIEGARRDLFDFSR
jgi:methylated-DNA-[protein]-cysteine S-methyltransferase